MAEGENVCESVQGRKEIERRSDKECTHTYETAMVKCIYSILGGQIRVDTLYSLLDRWVVSTNLRNYKPKAGWCT